MRLISTARLPFDSAWGFDTMDPSTMMFPMRSSLVEGHEIVSLDLERSSRGGNNPISFQAPPSAELDATFEFFEQNDSFSDLDDGLSVEDEDDEEPLACPSSAVVSSTPPRTPRKWGHRYLTPPDHCNDVTSTTSASRSEEHTIQETSMETAHYCFGPRGTENMMTCMRRSEETRMEIMAHLRTLPAQSVVVQDTNIHPFYRTKQSRERLMSCFRKRRREGNRDTGVWGKTKRRCTISI